MNRIVEAQEFLEHGGEAAPCMDSLFQAEHGLLGPEEVPSLSAVEPAPTASSSSRVSVFTLETIQSFPKARSRIGALYFSAQRQRMCCRDLAGFAQHVAELIQIHQKAVTYGFGFHLRYYTFFAIPGGDAWVVLASTHPLAMRKWYKVFVGLKAVDIRVPHATRQARIPPCESLLNVAEIFQGATTVEELARNRVDCTDPEPAGGKPRSKQGKRQGSSSSSSKETASQPEKEDAPPETDGESQVRVFPYASDFISDACLQFLRSTEWPDVMPVWSMIEQHLQQLKRPDQGQTARFILSPRPLEQFARAVHLRHAVHLVLETWNIRVASLSHADVSSSEGYHGLSQKSRAILRGVGALFDSDSCFPVFAFLDKVPAPFLYLSFSPSARSRFPVRPDERGLLPLHAHRREQRPHVQGPRRKGEGLLRDVHGARARGLPRPPQRSETSPTLTRLLLGSNPGGSRRRRAG